MTDKQKLNEKLARWAGFIESEEYYNRGHWLTPSGEWVYIGEHTGCHFTDSLDACFEWLVLKTKCEVIKLVPTTSGGWGCAITPKGWGNNISALADRENNPALALCLAIEKLINKE